LNSAIKVAPVAFAVGLLTLTAAISQADSVQTGKLLVSFDAGIEPSRLPRHSLASVEIGFRGRFENLDASDTPALEKMVVRLSRGGKIDSIGLPHCSEAQLRGRTSSEALSACREALVGEGTVGSALRFPDGRRLRSKSKLLLFNAPAEILMHIFTTKPLRGTFLVPLKISRGSGAFGTVLEAKFPKIAAGYGYLTGFEMVLHRNYTYRGHRKSFLLASCPAPAGFNRISFELARVAYRFRDAVTIRNAAIRSCTVAG
jgi:hypothetical protein